MADNTTIVDARSANEPIAQEDLDLQDDGKDSGPPEFSVWISRDKLQVLCDYPDPHADLESAGARIAAELDELELPDIPDDKILTAQIVAACEPDDHLRGHVLVHGQAPVPPVDGRLEWAMEFFATGFQIDDETDTIDFWERVDNRMVHADQLLARLHPAREGQEGQDVFANNIKAERPAKASLRAGHDVRTEEEADDITSFYAEVDGRIRLSNGTVTVDNVYSVQGDVCLETGNITHSGAIVINGDVKAGARIKVDGEIIVKGMLEACEIIGGSNLNVAGGILGSKEHSIEIAGDLQAKYISDATIQAGGDVLVTGEIDHSRIMAGGKVVVDGRIAGGKVWALGGIKVATAGADGATETFLAAGVDPRLEEEIGVVKERMDRLVDARDKIDEAIEAMADKPQQASDRARELLEDLQRKQRLLVKTIAEEKKWLTRATTRSKRLAVEKVVMLKAVHAGTVIRLGAFQTRVAVGIPKPRIAVRRKSKVRVLPLGDDNVPEDL